MTPQSINLHANGVSLRCLHWTGQKAPLLFLHGLGSSGAQFAEDAQAFAERGYEVVLPDLRAHGETSKPQKMNSKNMTVKEMATDVFALLDHFEIHKVHVIGNSMGGVIGLDMISRSPERVYSLTTFGTVYNLSFPPIVPWVQFLTGKLMGGKRLSRLTAKTVTNQERTREFILKVYRDLDVSMTYQVQKTLRKYDYLRIARAFDGPVLLLQGDADKEINAHLSPTLRVLAEKPNAKVVEFPNAGHFTNLDQPELVRDAILNLLEENAE